MAPYAIELGKHHHLALSGWMHLLTSDAGSWGLVRSAASLGSILAMTVLYRLVQKAAGPDIEKQAKVFYRLSSLAHLAFWGFILSHNILAAAAVMLVISTLDSPENVVWAGLVKKLTDTPERKEQRGMINGAISFVDTTCSLAGSLFALLAAYFMG